MFEYVNEVKIPPKNDKSPPNQQTSNPDLCATINIENVITISPGGSLETKTNINKNKPPISPTASMRSTSISISSIESDALSSIIESDVDEFEDTKTGCMLKKLGQQTTNPPNLSQISNFNSEFGILLSQQIERDVGSSNGPQIANLSVENSTDVTFGHKKYHRGPVTIQQILVERPAHNGHTNQAFDNSNSCSSNFTQRQKPPECVTIRENPPPTNNFKKFLNNKAALITAIIVILTLITAIVIITITTFIDDDVIEIQQNITEMISRDEWVAQPPNKPLEDLETPVPRVVIAHTLTETCFTKPACIFRTRYIQNFDIESTSHDDIRYNFLVGGDGNVYIGRGWDKVGSHTKGYNQESIGIALIGTFNKLNPPMEQLNATKWLLNEGVRLKKFDSDYKLYGSRQLDFSEGPGEVLFNIIKTWPHWSNE